MEMDGMDVDISVAPSATTTTRTAAASRFAPKQKGKPIKLPVPKPEPAEIKPTIPIPTFVKCESEISKDHIVNGKDEHDDDDPMQLDDNDYDDVNDDEKESEEDVVIQEINVYVSAHPLADEASLYVMQYPLRSSWRPYELNERCEEVRVKPKQLKVEVDLRLDVDCKNYDQDVAALGLQKQTLSSFVGTSMPYSAVGIRICNKLHLNPVDAFVQLRPSKKYINAGGQRRKHTALSQDAHSKPSEQGKPVSGDSGDNLEGDEPWVPLEYEPRGSYSTDDYWLKMVSEKNNAIQSEMKQSDYVSFLCPGTSSNKVAIGASIRALLPMPLEERLKKWLTEGPQVNRFASLLHLAPTDSSDTVFKVLQQYAVLVQGLWVTKSSLLYDDSGAIARDYILSQFTNNCVIRLEKQRNLEKIVKKILDKIAIQRHDFNDWKFKEPADMSFIKSYPNIVKEQEYAWACRVEQLAAYMDGARKPSEIQVIMDYLVKSLNPHMLKKNVDPGKVDQSSKNKINKLGSSTETTISGGTREDLINAVLDILQLHSVRSLDTIIKELKGRIQASEPELQSALSKVAVDVHGVHVLKSERKSQRDPALDPLRDFIIERFQQKKAKAKYREQDIRRAAQGTLKRNISDSEFKQVIDELCNSKGGLTLKSGDTD